MPSIGQLSVAGDKAGGISSIIVTLSAFICFQLPARQPRQEIAEQAPGLVVNKYLISVFSLQSLPRLGLENKEIIEQKATSVQQIV